MCSGIFRTQGITYVSLKIMLGFQKGLKVENAHYDTVNQRLSEEEDLSDVDAERMDCL